MSTITINGMTFTSNGNMDIKIKNGQVSINGDKVEATGVNGRIDLVVIEGAINSLVTDASVTAGNVGGNVNAGGSVTCENIDGSVNAGGSVRCGKIGGSLMAGGSVRHN